MQSNETILVMDFGGQYSQLIARRVRDLNVYCEIKSYRTPAEKIAACGYKGIIFSGGPNSVYADRAPCCDKKVLELGIPVLGICYGAQLMAKLLGGDVAKSDLREYGKTPVKTQAGTDLFSDMPEKSVCWMSHTDYISKVPKGFNITAVSKSCPAAAMEDSARKLYATQFHPEVEHTEYGQQILKNFLLKSANAPGLGEWTLLLLQLFRRLNRK